jgi:hypothetical protein
MEHENASYDTITDISIEHREGMTLIEGYVGNYCLHDEGFENKGFPQSKKDARALLESEYAGQFNFAPRE